ncbi:RloB domain-containing protein [Clostridium sp. MCC353]|uniref:RloB family protein n=1 Tax=Clostridium sp. MCC353 TaxID=2592646 RepID=UPI001C00C33F|nr:RloB family protein [Clostridium sp. MCC353]MBT9776449.1 RloB domain-containing protein [Clostridium sp. MCC353]
MRKEKRTYYFSVEGETEKWYLDWLQNAINAAPEATYTVKLDCKIQKNPLARVKRLTILEKTEITHVFDRESEEPFHIKQFQTTLDQMKAAQAIGKSIKYKLGYSNLTFELWIVLHKADCNGPLTHRSQYLIPLNRAYGEKFENLEQYKQADNFKRVLGKLNLEDVRQAVRRAKDIMKRNEDSGYKLQQYKGYNYYKQNPSLSIWETVEKILSECGIL